MADISTSGGVDPELMRQVENQVKGSGLKPNLTRSGDSLLRFSENLLAIKESRPEVRRNRMALLPQIHSRKSMIDSRIRLSRMQTMLQGPTGQETPSLFVGRT